MAVHQYIGARYVPYYYENSLDPTSTMWEPNVTYEALTVVTLPNNHSYISKKTVPANIGSPADNAAYWLDTGDDNAYIQDLQDQIDSIGLELDRSIRQDSIVWIGDSYVGAASLDPSDRHYRFSTQVSEKLGLTEYNYAVGGTGLFPNSPYNPTGHNFYAQAEDALADFEANDRDVNRVKYFVIGGGRNDISTNASATISDFEAYIRPLLQYIKLHFPYADIIAIPYLWDSSYLTVTGISQYHMANQCYVMYGAKVCPDAYVFLSGCGDYILNDGVHPNIYGHQRLSYYVEQFIRGGRYCNDYLRLLYPNGDYIDTTDGTWEGYAEIINTNIFHLHAKFKVTQTFGTGIVVMHTINGTRYRHTPNIKGVVPVPIWQVTGGAVVPWKGFIQWQDAASYSVLQFGMTGLNVPTGDYMCDFMTPIGHD